MTATLVIGLSSESELPGTIAQVRKKRPACLETLDQTTLGLMRRDPHARSILPKGECLLAIDFEGDEADVMARVESFANDDSLASADVTLLLQEHERTRFWDSRKQLSRRLRALAKHKVSEDVVVPITQMPTLWSEVRSIGERHQLVMPAYGHAGDGNLHVNILWNNADEKPAVELAVAELFTATLKLGGTLSGEHGIGITKRAFLPNALSAQNVSLQCQIKRVFDPDGIMNPGKIFSIGHGAC